MRHMREVKFLAGARKRDLFKFEFGKIVVCKACGINFNSGWRGGIRLWRKQTKLVVGRNFFERRHKFAEILPGAGGGIIQK